mgnify:CR=1 FL=1
MSELEAAGKIEGIVGAKRHPIQHIARAVSAEQRVYVLHSEQCAASGIDLRECAYSVALDEGIDLGEWQGSEDQPVVLAIDDEHGDLIPVAPTAEVRSTDTTKGSEQ